MLYQRRTRTMKSMLNSIMVADYCNLFNQVKESVEVQLVKENVNLENLFKQIRDYDDQLISILDTTSLDNLDRVITKLCNKILPAVFRDFVYESCELSLKEASDAVVRYIATTTCRMIIIFNMPKLWKHIVEHDEMPTMTSILGQKAIPLYCSVRAAKLLN